jgi:hypothetical protein
MGPDKTSPCQNGANCTDGINNYICNCSGTGMYSECTQQDLLNLKKTLIMAPCSCSVMLFSSTGDAGLNLGWDTDCLTEVPSLRASTSLFTVVWSSDTV